LIWRDTRKGEVVVLVLEPSTSGRSIASIRRRTAKRSAFAARRTNLPADAVIEVSEIRPEMFA